MSQITRCPSCGTTFKVVADQLRISEGWVRCGQCKEVFDASAHLLALAPAALLPDVSLTDVRPPPVPVPRATDTQRPWVKPPESPPATPASGASSVASAAAQPSAPVGHPPLPQPSTEPTPPVAAPDVALPPQAPVLEVPQPTVPAFLSAVGGGEGAAAVAGADQLGAFPWRSSPVPGAHDRPPEAVDKAASSHPPVHTPLPTLAAGYELPSAPLPDEGEAALETPALAASSPTGYPTLELPPEPVAAAPVPESEAPKAAREVSRPAADLAAVPLPPVDFVPPAAKTAPEALALVEDRSPASVLQARPAKAKPVTSEPRARPEDDEDEESDADGDRQDAGAEVSFVVAARRKAFWRKPLVRAVLAVLVLVSLAGLALQVAVQERDRLAALDVRTRPWLLALCAQLQCELAPYRQIADVVIDSSSFNKARGDSYQLALTMKSKAAIAVATPAVELTLTDAQDQPVLRRVLLPADMGAPKELPPRGEWSASVSVIVTTGGARVAGYRLLAFYP